MHQDSDIKEDISRVNIPASMAPQSTRKKRHKQIPNAGGNHQDESRIPVSHDRMKSSLLVGSFPLRAAPLPKKKKKVLFLSIQVRLMCLLM